MTNAEFLTALADDLERLPTLIAAERAVRLRELGHHIEFLEQQSRDYGLLESLDAPYRAELESNET